MMSKGLYIHVPFCLSKCPYCDFYSVRYSRSRAADYTEAVKRNIGNYSYKYNTAYFGGGTPILLYEHIGEILESADIEENAEVTVEANPCAATYEILRKLRQGGVNRLSLGAQSMNESELRFLGRRHSPKQVYEAVENARKAGIENISADIMTGLHGQDENSLKSTIDALVESGVTHISAYILKIESGTPFAERALDLPDEDRTAELYLFAARYLEERGFTQYEISNFSKSGYECKHNLKYWRCEEYLGVGPAAHSFLDGRRFCVPRDIELFTSSPLQTIEITDGQAGGFEEFVMLRLRLREGLRFEDIKRFGADRDILLKRAERLPKKLVSVTDSGISLTTEGFLVSNAVIGKLLGY